MSAPVIEALPEGIVNLADFVAYLRAGAADELKAMALGANAVLLGRPGCGSCAAAVAR